MKNLKIWQRMPEDPPLEGDNENNSDKPNK